MDTRSELYGERLIDHAMTGKSALSPECISHDIDPEMSFSTWPMSGVAFMPVGFVEHLQASRSEGLSELLRNGFLHTHLEPALTRTWSQRHSADGAFYSHVHRHPKSGRSMSHHVCQACAMPTILRIMSDEVRLATI